MQQARPLQPLGLRGRPIATRAISWSCDAELAIATDDTIHIFLPEYPRPGNSPEDAADEDAFQPQFTLALTTSGIIRPDPAINGPLCAFAGVSLPGPDADEPLVFRGVGSAEATRAGSSLGQSLGVEWSPNGLGQNLRPVLSIATTSGSIVALGEHIDSRTAVASSLRSRTFKHWKVLWGLGAQLPIPDGESAAGFRNMNERIVSFSWAREIGSGVALLAYMNDEREVVVMGVQFLKRVQEAASGSMSEELGWEIFEVDRFDGKGPHDVGRVSVPAFLHVFFSGVILSGLPCWSEARAMANHVLTDDRLWRSRFRPLWWRILSQMEPMVCHGRGPDSDTGLCGEELCWFQKSDYSRDMAARAGSDDPG